MVMLKSSNGTSWKTETRCKELIQLFTNYALTGKPSRIVPQLPLRAKRIRPQ